MLQRLLPLWIAWIALTTAACGRAPAVTQQQAVPDIWGVWMGMGGVADADPRFRNSPFPEPAFTAWGAEESKRLASSITPGECNPWSPVGFMGGSGLFPIQILQGSNVIVVHHEAITQPRRIYMDGRQHPPPEDVLPTFLGHSIGKWEGDTLVIDTTGTNGRARPFNGYVSGAVSSGVDTAPRFPGSEQLHLVERIKLVGNGQYLEDEITIEDPKTYTKPFTLKRYWQRRPDIDLQEYACTDNSRRDAEGQEAAAAPAK